MKFMNTKNYLIKWIFVLLLIAGGTVGAHAQWIINESFEGGAIPAGWTVYDANSDGKAQVGEIMRGDMAAEARTWSAMKAHMDTLADALSDGIAKQFPDKAH